MTHHRFSRKTAVYSLFQLTVGLGLSLMLTQMLCPRVHQKYLQKTIRDFSIAEDTPTDTRRHDAVSAHIHALHPQILLSVLE